MTLIEKILNFFDDRTAYETQKDKEILELIKNAPKSLMISRRGVISVDPKEISQSAGFKRDLERARNLVEKTNANT